MKKKKVKSQKDNYVFLEVERVVVGLGEELLHVHFPFYKRNMFLDE